MLQEIRATSLECLLLVPRVNYTADNWEKIKDELSAVDIWRQGNSCNRSWYKVHRLQRVNSGKLHFITHFANAEFPITTSSSDSEQLKLLLLNSPALHCRICSGVVYKSSQDTVFRALSWVLLKSHISRQCLQGTNDINKSQDSILRHMQTARW